MIFGLEHQEIVSESRAKITDSGSSAVPQACSTRNENIYSNLHLNHYIAPSPDAQTKSPKADRLEKGGKEKKNVNQLSQPNPPS